MYHDMYSLKTIQYYLMFTKTAPSLAAAIWVRYLFKHIHLFKIVDRSPFPRVWPPNAKPVPRVDSNSKHSSSKSVRLGQHLGAQCSCSCAISVSKTCLTNLTISLPDALLAGNNCLAISPMLCRLLKKLTHLFHCDQSLILATPRALYLTMYNNVATVAQHNQCTSHKACNSQNKHKNATILI